MSELRLFCQAKIDADPQTGSFAEKIREWADSMRDMGLRPNRLLMGAKALEDLYADCDRRGYLATKSEGGRASIHGMKIEVEESSMREYSSELMRKLDRIQKRLPRG